MSLKETALCEAHKKLGAKMVPFAGYNMPVFYTTIKEEHFAVRNEVGIFDVSHMGTLFFKGLNAETFLQNLCINDVKSIENGQVQYSAICNENGKILDDVLVYKIDQNEFQMVVNASNKEKIDTHIRTLDLAGVQYEFPLDEYSILALQGPKAIDLIEILFSDLKLGELKTYWGKKVKSAYGDFYVSRTGYTGEDGFEFSLNSDQAKIIWDLFVSNGALPAGLGCRDTLRLEAGYSLYGHELNEEVDPISAGLGWICPQSKTNYIGSEAIAKVRAEGVKQKVVGVELLEKAIPRQGCKIVIDGQEVGEVCSGSQSPTLNKFIGMAYINSEFAQIDREIELDIRGQLKKAKVVNRRFYQKAK